MTRNQFVLITRLLFLICRCVINTATKVPPPRDENYYTEYNQLADWFEHYINGEETELT